MGQGKLVANNKKARHDYFIEETYEAGIELTGTEVKSIRMGRINLKDSYAEIDHGEIFVHHMHISPYEQGNIYNVDPTRTRKLLLHKREINKLLGYTTQKGLTLVPLKVYINSRGLVKLELAVAKGKKLYDKRSDIAQKEANRRIQQELRQRQKEY
ncbi:SsrA-binding protein SmpB [Inediibacterium massiliense]|uniref:SsrA-binding protein SmpB n=1 Tax=Inediibacterium massiliense TaxID=1658111 RepID=UPI0006B5780F|nr:SsrA-binding protein SmpB [Inediibacterium massiliense]